MIASVQDKKNYRTQAQLEQEPEQIEACNDREKAEAERYLQSHAQGQAPEEKGAGPLQPISQEQCSQPCKDKRP